MSSIQLPIDELIKRYDMYERITTVDKYKSLQKTQTNQLNIYNNFQDLLTNFRTKYSALATAFNSSYSAASSNPSVASVSSVPGIALAPLNHTVTVTSLAQAESRASTATFSSNTTALNIQNTLTLNDGSNQFTVPVNATDTLQTIRDRINSSPENKGAVASILTSQDAGGNVQYQLAVSSAKTGLANAVSVSENPTQGNAFDFSDEIFAAQDAHFTFDGNGLTRASNTVDDVLDGLTFTLLSAPPPPATTPFSTVLGISENSTPAGTMEQNIKDMMQAYNNVMQFIDKTNAVPNGVDDLPVMKNDLKNIVTQAMESSSPNLVDIGIVASAYTNATTIFESTDTDGNPMQKVVPYVSDGAIEENTNSYYANSSLINSITTNRTQVQSLLTGPSGVFTKLNALFDPLLGTIAHGVGTDITDLGQSISSLSHEIDDNEKRINTEEDRLRIRYAKINTMLDKLETTRKSLEQSLQNLPKWDK
jgi:flagellar hook-associated protein 2